MFDVAQIEKRLAGVPENVAEAVRFSYVESHLALEDTARVMAERQQAQAMDAALASLELESSLMTLQQQVAASRAAGGEFAPPGVTDSALMNAPEELPALIRELSVDEDGVLQYKAERQRHTMGSLVGRYVDDNFTKLTGFGATDSRLQSGTGAWQLARWDHENSKWIPWNLGAAGEYLKSNGVGVAPSWHTPDFAAGDHDHDGVYAPVGHDHITGSPNDYDMLRYLPIYGPVDPDTGEPTVLGWDWQPFAPDMDDMAVWYGGDAATAADDPLLMLIARPVSNGNSPETFTYQGASMTIAAALLAMDASDPSDAWPKYLRMVSDGEGGWNLEWEDLCDQDGVPDRSIPYWYSNNNEIRLKYLPKGTGGQVLTSDANGDPGWAALPAGFTVTGTPDASNPLIVWNGSAWTVGGVPTHNHDGVYAPVHSHPYALDDHTHPFADLLSWMTEPATAADDPWRMLVMKPVSNGEPINQTFSFQTSTETIADALMGMTVDAAPTDGWPKYLRQVSDGEGVWNLEWEDLCDQDGVPDRSIPYWYSNNNEIRLKYLPKGTGGQVLTSDASGDPGWAALPDATTSKAGVIGPLPTEAPTTKYLNGAGAFVAPEFAADDHDHDGVYSPVGHSHPYVPLDYDYPFAELLSWMTEAATAADDPWQLMVMKPVSNGGSPETFSYQTSTETIADALMGMTVDAAPTDGWPKYLRQVSDGEGGWNLEWEDLCDQDSVPDRSIPYWYSSDNEIRLKYLPKGTDGQVLTSDASGDPGWAALPDAAADKKGVIQLDVASATTKYLNGAGQWTTPPDTNTDTDTWPSGGPAGYVWTSNGGTNVGSWQEPTGSESAIPPGTVLDRSVALWANSAGTITPDKFHLGSTRFGLFWDGNNGLAAVQAATADKQVLTWNNGGFPTWAAPTAGPPANPASVATLGSAAEGMESASGDTWSAGGTPGLDLWVVARVKYSHLGDKTLYKMMRKIRVGVNGQIYSVSGETRVAVDAAVSLFA